MQAAIAVPVSPVHARTVVARRPAPLSNVTPFPTGCAGCGTRASCLPSGVVKDELGRIEGLVRTRRRIRRGDHLYHAGEPFHALYALRTGFFKSSIPGEDGRAQVTGFQMPGDIIGLDGIGHGRHSLDVVALEDSEVCVIPYDALVGLTARVPALQQQLNRLMSREIVREQGQMLLLGTMRAESRVAAFLLSLAQRYAARGYSAVEFHLRMTREEIGSYLGLKLETVSRVISRFHERRLIDAHNRHIRVLDAKALSLAVRES
jgi:CRP/FNR family transcriptional regulator